MLGSPSLITVRWESIRYFGGQRTITPSWKTDTFRGGTLARELSADIGICQTVFGGGGGRMASEVVSAGYCSHFSAKGIELAI